MIKLALRTLASVAVVLVLASAVALLATGKSSQSAYISAKDIAAASGLESGHAYPVELGQRIVGTSGAGYFHGGFLTGTSGKISTQPGSSITVNFTHGASHFPLEIPTMNIHFVTPDDMTRSTMVVYLDNDGEVLDTAGPCGFRFVGVVIHYCSPPDLNSIALGPVLAKHTIGVTITLPKSQYDKYFGIS